MSAFTLCWFPFFVLALARPFVSQPDLVIPRWLSSLFLWLGYANSFLNPVIYATTNKDFRLPFREILCLRWETFPFLLGWAQWIITHTVRPGIRCKSLNSVMREDFYQSQYGNEANKTGMALAVAAAAASSSSSGHHKSHDANHYHHAGEHKRTLAVDEDDDVSATRASSAAAFLWPCEISKDRFLVAALLYSLSDTLTAWISSSSSFNVVIVIDIYSPHTHRRTHSLLLLL